MTRYNYHFILAATTLQLPTPHPTQTYTHITQKLTCYHPTTQLNLTKRNSSHPHPCPDQPTAPVCRHSAARGYYHGVHGRLRNVQGWLRLYSRWLPTPVRITPGKGWGKGGVDPLRAYDVYHSFVGASALFAQRCPDLECVSDCVLCTAVLIQVNRRVVSSDHQLMKIVLPPPCVMHYNPPLFFSSLLAQRAFMFNSSIATCFPSGPLLQRPDLGKRRYCRQWCKCGK